MSGNLKPLSLSCGFMDVLEGAGLTVILGSVYAGRCHRGAHIEISIPHIGSSSGLAY